MGSFFKNPLDTQFYAYFVAFVFNEPEFYIVTCFYAHIPVVGTLYGHANVDRMLIKCFEIEN